MLKAGFPGARDFPAMSKRKQPHQGHLYREPGPDREHLSMNDWYGYGVLMGLGGARAEGMRDDWHHWYCGQAVALNQYKAGYRDGLDLRRAPTFEEESDAQEHPHRTDDATA